MTDAGAARLRWLADFDVRARFGDERPDDMQQFCGWSTRSTLRVAQMNGRRL